MKIPASYVSAITSLAMGGGAATRRRYKDHSNHIPKQEMKVTKNKRKASKNARKRNRNK
jgi:hypothetical protein